MSSFQKLASSAAALGLFLLPGTASAIITAGLAEPTGSIRTDTYPGAGFGFSSTAGVGTVINTLGFWDQGGDGLQTDHTVALYAYNGSSYSLVVSATIPAGTGATLDGGYRWVNIPQITLPDIGQGADYYLLLATESSDPWTNGLGVNMDPSIGTEANKAFIVDSSTLDAPNFALSGGHPAFSEGYGGANLGFNSVPEPSALLCLGAAPLALLVRRRQA